MEQYAWVLWVILGISLVVAEIFTLGFVLLWFGIGALAAALVGYLGFGIGLQFLSFAIVSVALTALSRTIFSNYLRSNDDESMKFGADSLPVQIGTVTGASKGTLQSGEVKVFGSIWTAFPEEGEEPLLEGEKVEVVNVKGSSLYVKRIRTLPEWRDQDRQ